MNNLLSFEEIKTARLNTFLCLHENEHLAMLPVYFQCRNEKSWQLKVYAERGLFLYNMEIVDAQCDYMQTVQKTSVQHMFTTYHYFFLGTKDTLKNSK